MARKKQTPKIRKLKQHVAKKQKQLAGQAADRVKMTVPQALDRALQLHQTGQLTDAEHIYRQVLAIQPENPAALHYLGVAVLQMGRPEQAAPLIAKAITVKPDYIEAHNNLGNVLKSLGNLDKAAACFQKALDMKPDYKDAMLNLGNTLRIMGQYEEAGNSFRKAIDLFPDFAEAHNNLGVILMRDIDRLEEAADCFRKAVALKEKYAEPLVNLGKVMTDTGQLNQAKEVFEHALEIDPSLVACHNRLAGIYRRLGDEDKAIRSYEKVLEMVPGNPSATHLLAALKGEQAETAPAAYVAQLFNQSAEQFDHHLTEHLAYDVPNLLRAAFDTIRGEEFRFANGIDLGCGTGLSGAAFRDLTDSLIGVDISPGMIEKAKEKEIYDDLRTGELIEVLIGEKEQPPFDLFLAADTMIYVGALDNLFQAVCQRAAPGAWFLFSIEGCDDNFQLMKSGRFAHSSSYVEEMAEKYEFQVALCESVCIRKEDGAKIMGEIFILKRYDTEEDGGAA